MIKKTCKTCNINKNISEFYKDNSLIEGYINNCKKCSYNKSLIYKRSKKGLISNIFNSQKSCSRKRKHIQPEYTLIQLIGWFKVQENFETLYSNWVKSDYNKMLRPSIDRLKDNLPYTFDNIRLVTWGENDNKEREKKRLL